MTILFSRRTGSGQKQCEGDKNYNSAPNVDLGSTRIHGSDFQLFVESYSVRYFPVYPKGFDKLKKKFSFIGDKVSDVEISDLYKKSRPFFRWFRKGMPA